MTWKLQTSIFYEDLLEQLFQYYDKIDEEIRAELPLKRIWTVADVENWRLDFFMKIPDPVSSRPAGLQTSHMEETAYFGGCFFAAFQLFYPDVYFPWE